MCATDYLDLVLDRVYSEHWHDCWRDVSRSYRCGFDNAMRKRDIGWIEDTYPLSAKAIADARDGRVNWNELLEACDEVFEYPHVKIVAGKRVCLALASEICVEWPVALRDEELMCHRVMVEKFGHLERMPEM